MLSVAWVNLYICANILLALVVGVLAAADGIGRRLRRPFAYRHILRLAHMLIVGALLLPCVIPILGYDGPAAPRPAQVWSSPTMHATAGDPPADQRVVVSLASVDASMSLSVVNTAAIGLLLIGFLVQVARVGLDAQATHRIIAESQEIRHHGRLSIRASERSRVPFAFWRPARYFIVVPSALTVHSRDLALAIRHEAQHHRQQDTKWLYLYQLLKALFFWNPCVHILERQLRAVQELACDEALSGRGNVSAPEYCRCLLRLAEAAAATRRLQVRASMIGRGATLLLKRRIEAVLRRPEHHQRGTVAAAASVIAVAVLGAAALTFDSTIHDRRVSPADAAAMAAAARAESAFPIVVNDRVLRQLNLLLATPDGRAYLEAGLERMRSYEALILAELGEHDLPAELLAVPLVESGYRNLPPEGRHGAGLWQFVEPTARRWGLTVDAHRDERLDVSAETRAAMRYFNALHLQFGDWGLALLAYNTGSARVEARSRETASRDVWQIIGAGYENDPDYLARVMAAVLIVNNPSLLE